MASRIMRSEESWNSLHYSEASGDNADDGFSDVSMEDDSDSASQRSATVSPTFPTIGDVQRALHPLQATADRVGKQVERFAENLDRLSVKRQQTTQRDCRDVIPLVKAYKKIANDTVRHLESLHAPERQQQLSKKTKPRLRSPSAKLTPAPATGEDRLDRDMPTNVEDLKRWEKEEQTWDLLGLMLQVRCPVPDSENAKAGSDLIRPKKDTRVHQFSTEKDVWDKFLATDDQAWERHNVVEWLGKCADMSGQDVEQVVKELESGADRGSGLWAHSWLFTKEAIKGQKRLRSWPKALEPDDPGLDASLLNAERTKVLVTQLDPDAITRQSRSLEKQDLYFERAMWLACWEMVRRGKDWEYVREWCQERVEGWRATAMHGDPRSPLFHPSTAANWQSRALWRKVCALAAKDGGIDEYEKAVYGVLSGYLPSVQQVSRCWDDHLFAYYNSSLLHSFNRYLMTNFADRVPNGLTDKNGPFNFDVFAGQDTQPEKHIVEKMKHLEATREEATDSFKMLQGCIIANTFDKFVYAHGVKLAQVANAEGRCKIIAPMNLKLSETAVTAPISMDDHDFLRMITHIIFIFQDLGFKFGKDHVPAIENIIVAYVDYLSKAGKQQLLPLYASRLSSQRSTSCLGRQLPSIQEHGERETVMRLMKQYDINILEVLSRQMQLIILDAPPKEGTSKNYPHLKILEQSRKDSMGICQIQPNFVGNTITDDQRDLINGFEWYLLLNTHWEETMRIGAVLYKHFMRSDGLAAARLLSRTVTFSDISLAKTKSILGQTIDISRNQNLNKEGGNRSVARITRSHLANSHRRRRSSSAKPVIEDREMLLDQATTFRAFENLFVVLDALEKWKRLSDEGIKLLESRQDMKTWKDAFQQAYSKVETTIEPLLHNWLLNPADDAEAEAFKEIRVAFLPEIVLAYNTVLNTSSRYLSRDLLLKSMDLAALIAIESSDLAACFVAADRMPELVDSFAFLSKSIIQAEARGPRSGKGRKKRNGETLDLWTVRAPSN